MNFGTLGGFDWVFFLLIWALPFVIAVWFIRTLSSIAASLRDISVRLGGIERAVRDASRDVKGG